MMSAQKKQRVKKRKIGEGVCEFCGELRPLCYICSECGFTICQICFTEKQKMFTRSGVTWVCPSCLNWETL